MGKGLKGVINVPLKHISKTRFVAKVLLLLVLALVSLRAPTVLSLVYLHGYRDMVLVLPYFISEAEPAEHPGSNRGISTDT